MLKNTVKYYTDNSSHVFACFIDFSKAFDKANYWKLFTKLLQMITLQLILLHYLHTVHSHQQMCVRWKTVLSEPFLLGNGRPTRQGGILSPYLFSRYVRELLAGIISSNIDCNIGGRFFNILAYTDNMALLAPSWFPLQKLIDLLSQL